MINNPPHLDLGGGVQVEDARPTLLLSVA